jgi:hypothetical protein
MGNGGGLPRDFELQEIEETENALWVREQLNRIRVFLSERDADGELVATVDYLIEDNDRWISPEIQEYLLAGKLQGGEA